MGDQGACRLFIVGDMVTMKGFSSVPPCFGFAVTDASWRHHNRRRPSEQSRKSSSA